ncbi:EamA family transporter RarD [Metasolibacillus sp.]|uniref:EamA family transporter RarD n=1 Tax=Metasolibacillus sp. TaxID=2703680 RepID=UPI0025E34584|nr:EamA family transporter RarD [Metasolibacillus sp.]MCT6922930.1 EamA family transporter RarD [Metasolibacillus sp.]MCT6939168.1 EamA family transporter RarD [Metasolibacillus sp.]
MSEERKGILYTFLSYAMWGVLPLFWKLLEHVNSMEVLVGRVMWSFIFTMLAILFIGQRKALFQDLHYLWQHKKQFISLIAASFMIAVNWYIFIYAVNSNQMLETSLGYYINPLFSVLFGVLFFKERLSRIQLFAVVIAFIGVMVMTLNYGRLPWIALCLALTFAIYGVLKKRIVLDALRGLTIETLFTLPIAIVVYAYLFQQGNASFLHVNWSTNLLLMASGIATAIPLICFAKGAQRIPLYLIGFLQYIAPTMMLIIGVILYKEPFTKVELLAFSIIWLALAIFSISTLREQLVRKQKLA